MLLLGCVSAPPKVITITKVDCSVIPYIDLSNEEIDLLFDNEFLHDLLVRVDKQNRIIDGCK